MARQQPKLKNEGQEAQLFRHRVRFVVIVCFVSLAVLLFRLSWMQVVSYAHFQNMAQNNSIRVQPVAPTRGLIFDRNGMLLADNLPTYQLELTPEKVTDIDATLRRLHEIIPLTAVDRERFDKAIQRWRRGSFRGVPVKLKLDDKDVATFAVNQHRFQGVEIVARLSRYYPERTMAVHTIGYVGRIDESDLERLREADYSATTHTGKLGIERYYESLLHGVVGREQVEINAQGRVLKVLDQVLPQPGANLYLTLDASLQKTAEAAFGDRNGALVAIDPNNGEVLAMVSMPTYDPNAFVNGISFSDYAALQQNPNRPLFNRALTGQYPPGSTIKPFLGLAALETNTRGAREKIKCKGHYQLPGGTHKYRDWKKAGHDAVDLAEAIIESCDVFFYDLAYQMGIERMHVYLNQFGFGRLLGIDALGEKSGILPSPAWKKKTRRQPWFPGESLITGIGQGYFLATPLQLAVATTLLAKDGKMQRPHLLKSVEGGTMEDQGLSEIQDITVKELENWQYIKQAMQSVVHGIRGTARGIGINSSYRIAGKTGTAQVFSIAQDEEYDETTVAEKLRDHALFIAWAPAEKPRIVISVVVENGGSGGAVAAPIAKKLMDKFLLSQ